MTPEEKIKKLEDLETKMSAYKEAGLSDIALLVEPLETLAEVLKEVTKKEISEVIVNLKGVEVATLKGDKGDKPTEEELKAIIEPLIPEVKDGEDYILTEEDKKEIASSIKVPIVEKVIEKIEVIKEQPIITNEIKEVAKYEEAEQIVEKINGIPLDDEENKIGIEHIKGFTKLLDDKLTKLEQKIPVGGGVVGRDLIKDIDISSQLDGVTKTFNIQAVWNIFAVNLSSYPYGSLRKGVDYTFTPTSITFTSEIDAETQLASGQKCILQVVQG